MKKIKLVISDLHLGKGRIQQDGGTNPFEEFFFGSKLVEFLRYYMSGEYQDCEVELIINGDFLNFLQVDYKGHFLTVVTEAISVHKLKTIVDGHQAVFATLKDFANDPKRSITYVVGNHDQCMLWPSTRAYLNEVVGVSIRYKNLVYFVDGVHIEHGHMHEAANRFDPRKFFLRQNLPEPILSLPFGSHFFVDFVLKIKNEFPHVDKVRPFSGMIRWGFINKPWYTLKTAAALMLYFLRAALVRDPRRQFSFRRIMKVVLESAVFPDLGESAKRILNDERVHTVIFGHTHVYQYRQWAPGKEYFNTGTWTDVVSVDIQSLGKITKLTYVLLEYPDDGGRPRGRLKEWRGFHRIEEDVAVS